MSQYLVAVYKRNLVTPKRSCRVGQHVATNHMNKKKKKKGGPPNLLDIILGIDHSYIWRPKNATPTKQCNGNPTKQ
jgi:hypothetical protein